jgi:hypothetical protein
VHECQTSTLVIHSACWLSGSWPRPPLGMAVTGLAAFPEACSVHQLYPTRINETLWSILFQGRAPFVEDDLYWWPEASMCTASVVCGTLKKKPLVKALRCFVKDECDYLHIV